MRHVHYEEMIPFYVARTLPPDEAQALEKHLATCAVCRQSLAEWRIIAAATWEDADALVKNIPPLSAEVRSSVKAPLNGFNAELTAPIPVARHLRARHSKKRKRVLLAPVSLVAAVIIMILFGGLLVLMLGHATRPQNPIEPATALEDDIGNFAAPPNLQSQTDIRSDLGILAPVAKDNIPDASPSAQPLSVTLSSTPILALSLTATLSSSPPVDPTIPECFVTPNNRQPVTIHQWPGREQPIVGQMGGDEVLRVYVTDGQNWYNIIRMGEGILGWVSGEDVMLQGFCDNLWLPTPTMMATPNLGQISPCQATHANLAPMDLYSGPGTAYQVLGLVTAGATVDVLARGDNDWYRVNAYLGNRSVIGWLSPSQLAFSGDCTVLPIISVTEGYPSEATLMPTVAPPTATSTPITSTTGIINGRWMHTVTITEHGCGGEIGQTSVIGLTVNTINNEKQVILTYDNGFAVVFSAQGEGIYFTNYNTSALVSVMLTFTSATSYIGDELVTHSNGCVVRARWEGRVVGY